jgi:P27 family predicted phage terminase small subunit
MGARGPLSGARYGEKSGRKPKASKAAVVPVRTLMAPMVDPPPPAPENLGELGRQVWLDVWEGLPPSVLEAQADYLTVARLCEAAEDRAAARAAVVELGPLLEEPIVTPRGDVVGIRKVANPAAEMIRKLDRVIDAGSDRLGLSPAARARLGLTISRARLANADAATLLAGMGRAK